MKTIEQRNAKEIQKIEQPKQSEMSSQERAELERQLDNLINRVDKEIDRLSEAFGAIDRRMGVAGEGPEAQKITELRQRRDRLEKQRQELG